MEVASLSGGQQFYADNGGDIVCIGNHRRAACADMDT